MTKLLISVRSAAEAQIACAAGADLIDVKEPARGSLGAADATTIEAVIRQVAGRMPVSVALGELSSAAGLSAAFAGRVQYAKFGLAGCGTLDDWHDRWRDAIERLPVGVTPVAVAYADWQIAVAPDPRQVLALARQLGCGAVLVDTFDKSQGSLTEWIDRDELRAFIAAVQDLGLLAVVAGGLSTDQIPAIARLRPDYVAVRGAACSGGRTGSIDARRARRLAAAVRRAAAHAATTA